MAGRIRIARMARFGFVAFGGAVFGVAAFVTPAWAEPAGADAAGAECSAESWFCEEEESESAGESESEEEVVVVVEEPAETDGPPKRRKPKRAPEPPPPEVEPAPCEAELPAPPVPQPAPAPERTEGSFRAVGLSISLLLRNVEGSEEREGTLLGGGTLSLRFRPAEEVALDFGFAAMGGTDDRDRNRGELSGFTDLLWYPLVGDLRPYFLLGGEFVGASASWQALDGTERSVSFEYVAPRGGLGIEYGDPDWGVFFDGIVAPRFPTNEAAAYELRGDDVRTTGQLRGGLVTYW